MAEDEHEHQGVAAELKTQTRGGSGGIGESSTSAEISGLPLGYIPPEPDFEMPFDRITRPQASYERAQHVLLRHAFDAQPEVEGQTFLPVDWGDIDRIKAAMNQVVLCGEPRLLGHALIFESTVDGVDLTVVVRRSGGRWEVRTMWPTGGEGVRICRSGRVVAI